jgi:NitT/TauT family transport system substrate-binding protein
VKARKRFAVATVAALAALAASVGATTASSGSKRDKVTLQLKWVTQAQFAGYYAAKAKGYYDQAGLDVSILAGGPDIVPEQVVLDGKAQFGIDWLASLLATRDKGGDIVNIAQVFARSATAEVVWRDSGITSFCQLRGRRVGVWLGGNGAQFEQLAALQKCGINSNDKSQVTIVPQPFSMDLLLKRQVDAASADTYNELALVLETKNPSTGKLYQLSDLNVFKMQDQGVGMLEDGIFTKGSWLKNPKNQNIAKRFIEASLKGWIYCRNHLQECTSIVLKSGPTLGKGHQTWQMNEINALIWPTAPAGIGVMDPAAYARTAEIAQKFKIVKKQPSGAYRSDLATAAVADLKKQGVDVVGTGWKKAAVTVTPGGK